MFLDINVFVNTLQSDSLLAQFAVGFVPSVYIKKCETEFWIWINTHQIFKCILEGGMLYSVGAHVTSTYQDSAREYRLSCFKSRQGD